MTPHGSFEKEQPGKEQEEGEGLGGKLNGVSEVSTRAVSRGQNELIGESKMVMGDAISIRERL